ncbi:MAG: hypothetical protein MJZ81_10855 [Bacteroidales bacterium]|nr:hypothetical protein [Bacteroidales bacterium]
MKRVEELGISPTPWMVVFNNGGFVDGIEDASGKLFVDSDYGLRGPELPDARLMSKSPMLYDCLFEAVERVCSRCYDYRNGKCRSNRTADSCYAKRWREVLEKAGGERVENVNETECQ